MTCFKLFQVILSFLHAKICSSADLEDRQSAAAAASVGFRFLYDSAAALSGIFPAAFPASDDVFYCAG